MAPVTTRKPIVLIHFVIEGTMADYGDYAALIFASNQLTVYGLYLASWWLSSTLLPTHMGQQHRA